MKMNARKLLLYSVLLFGLMSFKFGKSRARKTGMTAEPSYPFIFSSVLDNNLKKLERVLAKKIPDVVRIDINERDRDGRTALHWASERGYVEIAGALLAVEGIDVNIRDRDKQAPLHLAAANGHVEIMKLLLGVPGINIYARDCIKRKGILVKTKMMPIHLAAKNGHPKAVKLLLDAGCDLHVRDGRERTPIHWASIAGKVNVARLLVAQKGADLGIRCEVGRTPLLWSTSWSNGGDPAMMRFLLGCKGVEVNARMNAGRTALHGAASQGIESMVKLLIEHGIDPNIKDDRGRTALHLASLQGNDNIVSILVKDTAVDVNAVDQQGRTSLHWALNADQPNQKTIHLLLEHGARRDIADKDGKLPKDLCKDKKLLSLLS